MYVILFNSSYIIFTTNNVSSYDLKIITGDRKQQYNIPNQLQCLVVTGASVVHKNRLFKKKLHGIGTM
jgi:hypothetical protein